MDSRLGNISWVAPSLIIGYDSLISAAKIWCEDLYRVMGRKGSYFLTNAIGCAMFGSAFDYANAIHYIPRAGWANARSKVETHLQMEKALTWVLRNALNRHYFGVTFIQQVVANKTKMDMSTLISFAEEVVGHLIYNAFRVLSDEAGEIILPKSWVIRACQQGPSRIVLGPAPSILFGSLSQILQILLMGKGGDLNYRGRPICDLHRVYKVSVTAKIFQMLTLVGHNLGTRELREKILRLFQSIQRSETLVTPLNRGFTEARTWDGAIRALAGFAEETDPILRVARKIKHGENNWSSGLRLLQWTSDKDLLLELKFLESGLARSSLKNEMPNITASSAPSTTTRSNMPTEPRTTETENLLPVQRTHEEERAAEKIFQCYRRYRRRLGGGLGGPLWEVYNDRANLLPNSPVSRLYKIHLRTAMPLVLPYLRHIINRIGNVHHEINKRVSSVPHEELDEVRAQAKVVRQLIRDAKAVAARISPDSSFHDMTSLAFLKGEVKQIVALKERAAELCPSLNKADMSYQEGVEFLVPRDPEPKSKSCKPPLLNTDDVFHGPNGALA